MRTDVSALYVDPRGPYPKLVADWWDEKRDGSQYGGPNPIIAHPPCGAWSNLRHLSNGAGRHLGPLAVQQVRQWGGVLEQPAGSKLWENCELPMPSYIGSDGGLDCWGGFSLEVEQVSWGHVARKKTWLYVVGISRATVRAGLRNGGTPTHWVSGGRNQMRKNGRTGGGCVPPGIKVCSAQQRRRTPVAFAEWLTELAASARREARTA